MIHHGDCLEVMRGMEANSIDTIITDPPYGLSFMGKDWDHGVPGVPFWAEMLRICKPGAMLLAFGGTRTHHRLMVAIEDAGWEIRDCLMWLYGCLSDDTECLTKTGWKRYEQITESDEVLQWDHSTNDLSWTHPVAVHVYPYSGDLVHIRNRHTDQLLTPNHRVYARIRRHNRNPDKDGYEVCEAGNLKPHWILDLPVSGSLAVGVSVPRAYLVGWWLTDAWKHGDGKAAMFSQSKTKTLAKLRSALEPYGANEYTKAAKQSTHNDEHTFYVSGELSEYLLQHFPSRELTWDVLTWDGTSRQSLLEGLLDGDGSIPTGQHSMVFWSKKAERLDVFQALALSLGYRTHIDYSKGCVYLNKKATTQTQSKHRQPRVPYNGNVWCLTVPTGAFVVRRNGRAFITGNSGFPKSMDISKAIDKAAGAEREVVGVDPVRAAKLVNQTKDYETDAGWSAGSRSAYITSPATDNAKLWNGWGTALKPAWEPIILAMKPLEGTYAANALKHGVAGLNIDGGRVGTETISQHGRSDSDNIAMSGRNYAEPAGRSWTGRWPANVVLDEEAGQQLDQQVDTKEGASRFFYCAKAPKKEKGPTKHPTVKPLALMEYLCNLTKTPTGGIILDPFAGSGTTLVAARNTGRQFIGIEQEAEYVEDIKRRLAA